MAARLYDEAADLARGRATCRVDPRGARCGLGLPVRSRARSSCRPSTTCWRRTHRRPAHPGPAGSGAGPLLGVRRAAAPRASVRGRGGDAPSGPATRNSLADCLDAALAAHWGPDELGVRRCWPARAGRRHRARPRSRTRGCRPTCGGCRWPARLLDVQAMHRQMRALELLGEESRAGVVLRRLATAHARPAARPDRHRRPLTSVAAAAAGQACARGCLDGAQSDGRLLGGPVRRRRDLRRRGGRVRGVRAGRGRDGGLRRGRVPLGLRRRRPDRARALVRTFHGPVARRPAPRRELAADPAVRARGSPGRGGPRGGRERGCGCSPRTRAGPCSTPAR